MSNLKNSTTTTPPREDDKDKDFSQALFDRETNL